MPYDVEYTLRLLAENGLGRESVLLYCLLGQLEAAVGIALVGQIWQLYVRLERICCSLGHRLTLPKKSSFIFLVKNNHRSSLFQVCIFGISVNKYFFYFSKRTFYFFVKSGVRRRRRRRPRCHGGEVPRLRLRRRDKVGKNPDLVVQKMDLWKQMLEFHVRKGNTEDKKFFKKLLLQNSIFVYIFYGNSVFAGARSGCASPATLLSGSATSGAPWDT